MIAGICPNTTFSSKQTTRTDDKKCRFYPRQCYQAKLLNTRYLSTPTNSLPALQSNLTQLLGQTIERVEGTSDGTLSLLFTNGHRLMCFDDPRDESYQIRDGARTIIVWLARIVTKDRCVSISKDAPPR